MTLGPLSLGCCSTIKALSLWLSPASAGSFSFHFSCSKRSVPGQTASIDTSIVPSTTKEPHQVILGYNVMALFLDPQGISRILLARGLISEHTEAQMQQISTVCEKATILVSNVRQVIKISPKQFHVFLGVLLE